MKTCFDTHLSLPQATTAADASNPTVPARPHTMIRRLALLLAIPLALQLSTPAFAGPGHDHDHAGEAPAAAGDGPRRLADGSVFLPKPTQRMMGLRTIVAAEAELPQAVELAATVTLDPNAGGRVQPTQGGRLEAGPRGLPGVGQKVAKGEVLAHVVASAAALERADQQAQLAEARSALALADKRLARLQELADTVPRRDLEAAASERDSLAARASSLAAGLSARETLVAPVAGVIASAAAVSGQVVAAGETLFEIVDPARMQVEALAFDAALAADVGSATLVPPRASAPGGSAALPLHFIGAGRILREQALPLVFRAEGNGLAAYAIGQPVKVVVQTRSTRRGVAVPSAALSRNAANQTMVWIKQAPERFEPRVVAVAPLDGARSAVLSGLAAGERVVSEGAALVGQVR